jgi:CubicO group peptidase (beta-lactamase class C family)
MKKVHPIACKYLRAFKNMPGLFRTMSAAVCAAVFLITSCNQPKIETVESFPLETGVDSLIRPWLDSAKIAGASIAVYKEGKPILFKSYGYADLEHDVKLPVNASFEIGSVTKQFTCVAVLQLVEQKKLALDDDCTKYVKFDTKGRTVTVQQLMNHTSGIKGYTEMEAFMNIAPHKLKRDTLLRLVEKEPFDFEPGTALIYNNSGFFILGLIMEKVSGISYEEYVQKNLFEKVGMSNSYYCSQTKLTKNRAHGYDMGDKGLQQAMYLDHTWPYSAGSLCSTAEDLAKWNDALHNGKVLSEEMYKKLLDPAKLSDGSIARYANGLSITKVHGKRRIEHGGGIPGFLSANAYFPDDKISITVLMNTTGPVSPGKVADFITDKLFGKDPDESGSYSGDLSKFNGVFNGPARGRSLKLTVTDNDTTLFVQRDNDKPVALKYLNDQWTNDEQIYQFVENNGAVDQVRIDQVYGYYILKKATK